MLYHDNEITFCAFCKKNYNGWITVVTKLTICWLESISRSIPSRYRPPVVDG